MYVLIICALTCIGMVAASLFKPKVKIGKFNIGTYWLVTIAGATVLMAFQFIEIDEVINGLTTHDSINPIKILLLFIAMTVISIFLDETGFFRYLASHVLSKTDSNQVKLFTSFYIFVAVLTVFTSNDVMILTFTPFICYFAKNAGMNPMPYLVSTFVAADTGSMLLIIGNPTNIYLSTAIGIGFMEHLWIMAIPTLFAVVTGYVLMRFIFRKELNKPFNPVHEKVVIEERSLLYIGVTALSVCTGMLAISSYINIEMWMIACASAVLLTISVSVLGLAKHRAPKELIKAVRRAPWELVPFLISMFIVVLSLEKYAFTADLANLLGDNNVILTYGLTSALFSNLINNIPMSVLFCSVLQNLDPSMLVVGTHAVIIGSNLGALLTPIGALAGLLWLSVMKNNGIEVTFLQFVKNGITIAVPMLFTALGGLMLVSLFI